jgi:negative regulator of flagellin synthesis FlgM
MSNDISRISGSGATDARSNAAGDARGARTSRGPEGGATKVVAAQAADAVTVSRDASKIISIEAKLRELPEIDQPRVDRIRAAIANGEYHVDPRRVAQKFLELDGQL